MTSKQLVRAMLNKMPDDVSLEEVVSWIDTIGLVGHDHARNSPVDVDKDLAAFFSRKQREASGSDGTKESGAKKKILNLLSKLREDVGLGEILNRLVLLKKIEV